MKLYVSGHHHDVKGTFELTLIHALLAEFVNMAEKGEDREFNESLIALGRDTDKAQVLNWFTWQNDAYESLMNLRKGISVMIEAPDIAFAISNKSFSDATKTLLATLDHKD